MADKIKVIGKLENLEVEGIAHGNSIKRVFLNNLDSQSDLTQLAFGIMEPGQSCEAHIHPTMEEFFFFIKGRGIYNIGGEEYPVSKDTFLRIPANVEHDLKAVGTTALEFVYFGVAI